jgi:hypothetical protein
MRLNSKGQVTIPATLREGTDCMKATRSTSSKTATPCDSSAPQPAPPATSTTSGQRLVHHMRGRATTTMTTDELLGLLRDE